MAGGAMEQTNLAAAILRIVRRRLDDQQTEANETLSDEEAIELAGWLQSEPSLSSWRQIYVNSNSARAKPGHRPRDR